MSTGTHDWQNQPRQTRTSLARDLRRLGLDSGHIVLVHSSLSGLGLVDGGADAVIDALLDAVGPTGTVVFPTLTGGPDDGPEAPPYMDVGMTACWTGRIPETARKRPAARRSLHPTHSVAALGAAADRYATGHETSASPCDERSPYFRLIREGRYILLLGGVTQESNTTLHCLEVLAHVPYHLQDETTKGVVVDADGRRITVRNRLHVWRNRLHPQGFPRNFSRISAPLDAAGAMRTGRVGASTSMLMSASGLADTVLPLLRENWRYLLKQQES
jgi:aminoglycoside 3-N-acetyltransferase